MHVGDENPTRLWLVRHGESVWNREGRLQGQTMHVPLTALGLGQARAAASRLRAEVGDGAVRIVSSDQKRARQTADVVAEAFAARVTLDQRLREQALGDLEGRLTRELAAQPVLPGEHISEVAWGGGESVAQVHARCREFVRSLGEAAGDVVVVSHGDTLRILLAVLAGLGHRDVEWRPIASAEVIGPIPLPVG